MARAMIIFEDREFEDREDEVEIWIENVLSDTPTPAKEAAMEFFKRIRKIVLADKHF
jgi:hypothetical protein